MGLQRFTQPLHFETAGMVCSDGLEEDGFSQKVQQCPLLPLSPPVSGLVSFQRLGSAPSRIRNAARARFRCATAQLPYSTSTAAGRAAGSAMVETDGRLATSPGCSRASIGGTGGDGSEAPPAAVPPGGGFPAAAAGSSRRTTTTRSESRVASGRPVPASRPRSCSEAGAMRPREMRAWTRRSRQRTVWWTDLRGRKCGRKVWKGSVVDRPA